MVLASSPVLAASVSRPTGPPPNFSIIVLSIVRSTWSRPSSSTSSMFSASRAMSTVIWPSPFTCAKSRTRRISRLAMRGVPRLRLAISSAPSWSQSILRIWAERRTITASCSGW